MRYIFSGNMPAKTPEILMRADDFKPISLLVTQLERKTLERYIEYKRIGYCDFIMMDSGAYSVFTGRASTTIDQYIDFINVAHKDVDVFVELDTIPGEWGKSKKPEDYIISADKSWNDFLYTRERVCCPEKIMSVFHSGEPYEALKRTLEWTDSSGKHLDYIGISAAKDADNKNRDTYMQDVRTVIDNSSNPNVGTHLFGTTALNVLKTIPCRSCDSTTHVRMAGFGCLISPTFGQITVSSKGGTKGSAKTHFLHTADSKKIKKLEEELEPLKLTIKDIADDPAARTAFNIRSILQLVNTTYAYHPSNSLKRKSLI